MSANSNQSDTEQRQITGENTPPYSKYSRFNPMRIREWYKCLDSIEKFNFLIMLFTGILSGIGLLQYVAYIETERAYLIIEEIRLFHNEPVVQAGGLDVAVPVKNVGKHIALITDFKIAIELGIINKDLPVYPDYTRTTIGSITIAPIASQKGALVPVREKDKGPPPIPREELIRGINEGTYSLDVYGVVQYKTGYFWFEGMTGFCFHYMPIGKRTNSSQSFNTCQSQNYTYAK